MKEIFITKISKFLPNQPVENDKIEDFIGYTNQKPSKAKPIVLRNNGIKTRYYIIDKDGTCNYTNSGLTANAINNLWDENVKVDDLELLSCGTSSPDQLLPSHASMVHGEIGGKNIEIASFSGSCCSGMSALKYGYMAIKSGEKKNAVCTGSELASLWIHSRNFEITDERIEELESKPVIAFEKEFLRWMLSDGAGAVLLEEKPRGNMSLKIEWIETCSYANELESCMYSGAKKNEDGSLDGWRLFEWQEKIDNHIFAISQDTKLLEKNILSYGKKFYLEVCKKKNLDTRTVDYFLPHLSSEFFRNRLIKELSDTDLSIPQEKWYTNLSRVGNIGSASFYIMMEELFNSGKLVKGQKLLAMVPESSRFTYTFALFTVV